MKAPDTFSGIIDLWPSRIALAEDVGTDAGLVRSWHARDRIPDEYWSSLVVAAGRRGFKSITAEHLTALAATKKRAA